MLLCRAHVTHRDLTLHKFKDLFSPINHIQNNHTYSFLIHSFSPSCWFLLWVSDQSFIFSFDNNSWKICWRLEEFFLFGVSPLPFPSCFSCSILLPIASSSSALPREHTSIISVFSLVLKFSACCVPWDCVF